MKQFYIVTIFDDGATRTDYYSSRAVAKVAFDTMRESAQYSLMQFGIVGDKILGRAVCENAS